MSNEKLINQEINKRILNLNMSNTRDLFLGKIYQVINYTKDNENIYC